MPEYIRCILASFFRDRALIYDTEDEPKTFNIKESVSQHLVLGPLLWNIMLDAMVKIPMPPDTNTNGLADDVRVVIEVKYLMEVKQMSNQAFATSRRWFLKWGLQRTDHKTESGRL